VIISRTRFIKTLSEEPIDERRSGGSLMTNLGTVLRNMSEATTKSRKAVPFRSHPLIDYLRDAISSHSSVRVICCINSIDYSETLRYYLPIISQDIGLCLYYSQPSNASLVFHFQVECLAKRSY
jgi:hypothetical protein